MTRWLRIDVDMQRHPVVGAGQPIKPADSERGSFSRYEAWTWLLSNAAWRAHDVRNNGRVERLEVGQCLAARDYLARQWNWTVKTVSIFLDKLRAAGMVEWGQSEGRFARALTICNYEAFQQPKGPQRAVVGTVKGQLRGGSGAYKHQKHQKHQTDRTPPPTPNGDERDPRGDGDSNFGYASGWTPAAIAVVDSARASVAGRHVVNEFVLRVCGTLSPPRGVDAASFAGQMFDKLQPFPPAVLEAVARRQLDGAPGVQARKFDLLPVPDLVAVAKAETARHGIGDAEQAPPTAGDPALVARWPEIRAALTAQLGGPVVASWFGAVVPTQVTEAGRLILAVADPFKRRHLAQTHEQATARAAAKVLPGVSSVEFVTVEAIRERAA